MQRNINPASCAINMRYIGNRRIDDLMKILCNGDGEINSSYNFCIAMQQTARPRRCLRLARNCALIPRQYDPMSHIAREF